MTEEKSTVARKRIDAQLRAAVIRGVRLLDAKDSAWWNGKNTPPAIEGMTEHIDLEMLDMAYGWSCVVGQRHESGFCSGMEAIGVSPWGGVPAEYGFDADPLGQPESLSLLTELWASVIQSRRYPRRKIASDPWVKKANKTWRRA